MGINSVILSGCKYGSWRGRVLSVFRGAALNPTVNVFLRPFAAAAAADLSHGFRMERATVDFTAAKPLFPARQLFRERVKSSVWHLLLRVKARVRGDAWIRLPPDT